MEELSGVPFVILGNKIDHPDAVSEALLWQELNPFFMTARPIRLFMCSIVLRQGYGEAIRWLVQQI